MEALGALERMALRAHGFVRGSARARAAANLAELSVGVEKRRKKKSLPLWLKSRTPKKSGLTAVCNQGFSAAAERLTGENVTRRDCCGRWVQQILTAERQNRNKQTRAGDLTG